MSETIEKPTEQGQVRANLTERFEERVRRLHHLLDLRAPSVVMCAEVQMVWEAAFALYPEAMRDRFSESVGGMCSERLGACRFCRVRRLKPRLGMCQACWDEAKALDDGTAESR